MLAEGCDADCRLQERKMDGEEHRDFLAGAGAFRHAGWARRYILSSRQKMCEDKTTNARSPSAKYMKNTSQLLHDVITRTAAHPSCVELIAQIERKIERSGQFCR